MGTHFKEGFTIIETMLVLAITGTLVVALLAGVGTSINVQRYRDSATSLKSVLQDQYSEINNVRNDRDANWSCSTTAKPVQGGTGTIAQGQSNCVVLGRYVSIINTDIITATVVGYENSTTIGATDVSTIKNNYTLGISSSSIEQSQLEWGTKLTESLAVLMVRSPESGTTYTFTNKTPPTDIAAVSAATLKGMLVEGAVTPGQGSRTLCIDPNGLIIPEKLAVFIAASATGPSSIETRSNSISSSLGGTPC